jgi:outer membrane protein OmpA-like peptidoglycan-associated protein
LQRSKELQNKGGDYKDLFKELAQGQAQIQRANEYAKISENSLGDVLKVREEARTAQQNAKKSGATNLSDLTDDFNNAEKEFQRLTEYVENNDLKRVDNNRAKVIEKYRNVSTKFIRKEKLGTAKRIIDEAIRLDAKEYAPKSLAYAQESVSSAEKFIANNPQDAKEIDKKGEESLFYAKRALILTQQSKTLADSKPEERVLWVEQNIVNLGDSLGIADRRDEKLDVQFNALQQSLRAASVQKAKVAGLRTELQEALPQIALDKKVKEIRSKFKPQEADILRKDDKIIVRMKGLKFPSGKARLGSENFELLAKAKDVLTDLPNSQVIVEGHTDAVGTKEANEKLSQRRADIVKDYFVKNDAISEDQISSVGKSFDEPITTNKTKEGRSKNRRIDLVIVTDIENSTGAAE